MRYPLYNPFAYFACCCIDFILLKCVSPFLKKNVSIAEPKKILLCNIAHLGDVVLTTSLLPVLRKAFPNVKIGMLIGSWSLPIIQNHPLVDAVHLIDHWKVNRKKHSLVKKIYLYYKMKKKVQKELKDASYDIAIDCCFHFPNASFLLARLNIPTRIGFSSVVGCPLLTHTLPWDPKENRPAVEAFFSLLAPLKLHNFKTELYPALLTSRKKKKQDFLVIHMGAGLAQKKWPLNKWKSLVERLVQEKETIYFTGQGEEETNDADEIVRLFPRMHNLCNKLSWQEFTEIIQQAALLIGVDSCAGHIAAAVNTPAVLLYTGIHPPKLWAPSGEKIKILSHPVSCSPCLKGCQNRLCIKDISVDTVYAAVRSIYRRA